MRYSFLVKPNRIRKEALQNDLSVLAGYVTMGLSYFVGINLEDRESVFRLCPDRLL